jgi:hypothetical protein
VGCPEVPAANQICAFGPAQRVVGVFLREVVEHRLPVEGVRILAHEHPCPHGRIARVLTLQFFDIPVREVLAVLLGLDVPESNREVEVLGCLLLHLRDPMSRAGRIRVEDDAGVLDETLGVTGFRIGPLPSETGDA